MTDKLLFINMPSDDTPRMTYEDLPQKIQNETAGFRNFVKKTIVLIYENPKSLYESNFVWAGSDVDENEFELWVANGYDFFRINDKPEFTKAEKEYLWRLYKNWQKTQ